ncbi:hypothetical protein [Legionella israelensis]|uniref:Uncharacterized protein n=1 Tax=Legionella israelensis TaxID=454 RepID=A0A0W0VTC6_9GAMM|nr:hypothetical protein [Legionella israelensis]KTD23113.1 hypothetical protein Lisr_1439 [Legionella israelensis]QBS10389.1 hypothetical protein E4T55_11270 [Legionella israelensis]SCY57111.1 hypothetical protein SAMN02746069_02904 [Legionella israelensis DSM 19235]STX60001.1 Uncharacterised protein [Legionella israelensis]
MANESKSKRDERSKALAGNPCGKCRAAGLPICKGHGGGAGGDEAKDENASKDNAPTPKNVPSNIEVKALSSYLENSEVWNSDDDFLYNFNNDLAVFSIELDLAKGVIHFQGNESLSANDKKDLNELYDKIEDELKMFTDEADAQNISFSRKEDNLKINIPDPKLYDQFVTRLLNKNLIPDNNYNADLDYKINPDAERKVDVNKIADSSYKLPNPFDISKGPRLPDDG